MSRNLCIPLLAAGLLADCGTLYTATAEKCGSLYPYSGTAAAARGHATQLDVPFSLIADTLLLPYSLPKSLVQDCPARETSKSDQQK